MKHLIFFLASIFIVQNSYSQKFNTVQHIESYHVIGLEKTTFLNDEEVLKENLEDKVKLEWEEKLPDNEDILKALSSRLPLSNMSLTSSYGYRTHPVTGKKNSFHSGVDLVANSDTVYSVLHGTVIAAGHDRLLGNYVKINHGNYESIVGHLSTRFVAKNELVPVGFPIGITGKTGRVTGEHLHFTVKYKGDYINPLSFLASIISLKGHSLLIAIQ